MFRSLIVVALLALTLAGTAQARIIYGSNTADQLTGSQNADHIEARGGADEVDGRDGRDRIWGGKGRDQLWGAGGNDIIKAGCNTSVTCFSPGGEELYGEAGGDTLGADNGIGGDLVLGMSGWDSCSVDKGDIWGNDCDKLVVDGECRRGCGQFAGFWQALTPLGFWRAVKP